MTTVAEWDEMTDTDAESMSDEGSTMSDNDAWSAASTEQVTAEFDEAEPEEEVPTTSSDEEEDEQEDEDEEDYQEHLGGWHSRLRGHASLLLPSSSEHVEACVKEGIVLPGCRLATCTDFDWMTCTETQQRQCCMCKIPRGHDANQCSEGVELSDNSCGLPSTDWRCCCCYWDYEGRSGEFGSDNFNQYACSPCKNRRETWGGAKTQAKFDVSEAARSFEEYMMTRRPLH